MSKYIVMAKCFAWQALLFLYKGGKVVTPKVVKQNVLKMQISAFFSFLVLDFDKIEDYRYN